MGLLIEGKWQSDDLASTSKDGKYQRKESSFRNWVTVDGSPGVTGRGGFKAEANRYHLYVSLACPWAHRAIVYRKLKGLEDIISISIVNAVMGDEGWSFKPGLDVISDPINNAKYAHEIYTAAQTDFTGRVTVPILWDKKNQTIVSNESSEIIRMFNSAFDLVGGSTDDFYPTHLQAEIDEINRFIYRSINNGVYRAGFATTQEAYTEAVGELFDALDTVEASLSVRRYLTGNRITEADWRLFTTLVRFDAVYVHHFKCNLRSIVDYPNIWGYLRDLYQVSGVADTVVIEHIKAHYYLSHKNLNPTRIIPVGPEIDFTIPHNRMN